MDCYKSFFMRHNPYEPPEQPKRKSYLHYRKYFLHKEPEVDYWGVFWVFVFYLFLTVMILLQS